MTPAEQTAQAVKILVAMIAAIVVGVGAYAYVHHRLEVHDREQSCFSWLEGGSGSRSDCDQ